MWNSQMSIAQVKLLFDDFLSKYISEYDENMSEYIKNNFYKFIGERLVYSELLQIYSDLGIISNNDNHYYAYFEMIKNNFDINCNILEVASGKVPALANIIAKEQLKMGKGTITVYEPGLVDIKSKYSNMKLCKEEFNDSIDISGFDLVVSIMPCLVTEDVLRSTFRNNKDFFIAFCGCEHYPNLNPYYMYGFPYPSYHNYIYDAKKYNEEYNLGDIIQTKLDDKYEIDYPIIYNKRKKI